MELYVYHELEIQRETNEHGFWHHIVMLRMILLGFHLSTLIKSVKVYGVCVLEFVQHAVVKLPVQRTIIDPQNNTDLTQQQFLIFGYRRTTGIFGFSKKF